MGLVNLVKLPQSFLEGETEQIKNLAVAGVLNQAQY